MIISQQKPLKEILQALGDFRKVFLVGCTECATICKSGGEEEILVYKKLLEENAKLVCGYCIPEATCNAFKLKQELAKHVQEMRQAEAILVFTCGLGVQSVKDNQRFGLAVLPACNTLFAAVLDKEGNLQEKCSLCGECVLAKTGGICPVTLCPKGILNGPCGGVKDDKCEVDREKDCAWVAIYKELKKNDRLAQFKELMPPRDYKKSTKPQKLIMAKKA